MLGDVIGDDLYKSFFYLKLTNRDIKISSCKIAFLVSTVFILSLIKLNIN